MKSILIVDKDQDIIDALKEVLAPAKDCKIHYTSCIKQACSLLMGIRYDIILLDYNLFKTNTYGVMSYLDGTKIIMTNTLNDCFFEHVLKKPFNIEELFQVLEV